MKKTKLAVTDKDNMIAELVGKTDHKTLAVWACDCAERTLPYFENKYPQDNRPRRAIEAGRAWAETGVFKMVDIRKIALAAHAAAREVKDDNAARQAARAVGHALATAHVPTHAVAAAIYAATAYCDAAEPANSEIAAEKEREWQLQHLRNFSKS
jgi:Imm-5 like putative immunity protein